jgi:hypothetical protein
MAGLAVDGKPAAVDSTGRPRWLRWAVSAGLVIALAVVTVVYFTRPDNDPGAGVVDNRPLVTTQTGVFRGAELEGVKAFQAWLGRDVNYAVDFPSRADWQQISAPQASIDNWKGSGYRPIYSIAMLPENPEDTMERGATGEYDHYYRELARRLVEGDQANAIIRLGWEFNLEGSRWATGNRQAFIDYWRHVVTAMRQEPGQKFEFDWNPNNGNGKYDAVHYYPGNDVVDYIGIDAYDVSWAPQTYPYPNDCDGNCRSERQKNAWNRSIYGGSRGLKFWSSFARSKGKPLSLPEWGMWERLDRHGGGDDPEYLRRMKAFIADPKNRVAYQSYFEFDGEDGPHRLMTTYPDAGKVFRSLFGAP